MSRIPPVPLDRLPPALAGAIERGRANRMLSSSVPPQVWAHRPAVAQAWLQALDAMHVHGVLNDRLRELVRLRIASITTCQACQLARKSDEVTEAAVVGGDAFVGLGQVAISGGGSAHGGVVSVAAGSYACCT